MANRKANHAAHLADLLTQRLDVHEKTAWMLRSLLDDAVTCARPAYQQAAGLNFCGTISARTLRGHVGFIQDFPI